VNAKKRRRPVTGVQEVEQSQGAEADLINGELRAALDEAVNHLPEKYRAAIVLCYLEGKTNEEAARLLHCQTGALEMRLTRARLMLASRLARRGVMLSPAVLVTLLTQESSEAAAPAALATTTVQVTTSLVGETAPPAMAGTAVGALADATLKAMAPSKWRMAAGILLALLLVG